MIKIKNLSISYGNNKVLENINIEINSPGIYYFYGESGSGKSSLLNILSLMENRYEGEFYFDTKDVSSMKEEEKSMLRFNKITYLFQIPKLIENESIITNLEIALGRKLKKDEEKKLLTKIRLNNGKKKISILSGGEKQRVNILMGLLRNTPIILGDEITSGLDEHNKKIIMDLLKEESKKRIIILVSHDENLMNKYTKNGRKIENKTIKPLVKRSKYEFQVNEENKDNCLPFFYSIKHVINTVASKKLRTIITLFSSLIAFVCLGLCLILTSTLKDSILSSLGSFMKDNQIVMERKEESFLIDEDISISKKDAISLKNEYDNLVSYLGVNYLGNIDSMFEDENYFAFYYGEQYQNIYNLTINNIKDYEVILDEDIDLFYMVNRSMQEDEIVLSLTHGEISRLCSFLGYEYKDDSSLLECLKENPLELKLFLSNEEWEYNLEANFYLVGYTISDTKTIYHRDSLWNEYVIEEVMQLESSLKLSEDDYYPWTLKKEYFLYCNEVSTKKLLECILENKKFNDYVPKIFKKEYGYGISFEYAHNNYLHIDECKKIIDEDLNLNSFIPCSSLGYNVIENVMLGGFTYPTFISQDYELLEEFINMNSYSDENLGSYQSTILSYTNEDIISMSLLDSTKSNYCLFKVDETLGEEEINVVNISRGLLKKLKLNEDSLNVPLFMMYLKSIDYANKKYKNNFEIVRIKIKNVIDDDSIALYSNYLWPITFLMINFNIKNIGIDKIIINYSGNNLEEKLMELKEKYNDYSFSAPYLEYSKNIEEVEKYLLYGLTLFSSFCLLSTLLMLIVSSNLFISELKKEIGIYSLYGYEKKSVKRLYKIFSYFLSLYSFILSFVCLIAIFIVLGNKMVLFNISNFKVLFIPALIMLGTSLIIGFISSRASTYRVFKENPLKQLVER